MDRVSELIDVTDTSDLHHAVERARKALGNRECVVLPTDTVYGIGADAFSPLAVAVLLAAKGRGRTMPPPVLISDRNVMQGLAYDVPEAAEQLAAEHWPGPLTLILKSQPTLTWDLGETRGTVALRVPADPAARELLYAVGPMAVSSANRTGMAAATTVQEAQEMLGETVSVYLDGGPRTENTPSTIVDCTVTPFRVARQGALPLEVLRETVPDLLAEGEDAPPPAGAVDADPATFSTAESADSADGAAAEADSASAAEQTTDGEAAPEAQGAPEATEPSSGSAEPAEPPTHGSHPADSDERPQRG